MKEIIRSTGEKAYAFVGIALLSGTVVLGGSAYMKQESFNNAQNTYLDQEEMCQQSCLSTPEEVEALRLQAAEKAEEANAQTEMLVKSGGILASYILLGAAGSLVGRKRPQPLES